MGKEGEDWKSGRKGGRREEWKGGRVEGCLELDLQDSKDSQDSCCTGNQWAHILQEEARIQYFRFAIHVRVCYNFDNIIRKRHHIFYLFF